MSVKLYDVDQMKEMVGILEDQGKRAAFDKGMKQGLYFGTALGVFVTMLFLAFMAAIIGIAT